jgi:hypothetical protein
VKKSPRRKARHHVLNIIAWQELRCDGRHIAGIKVDPMEIFLQVLRLQYEATVKMLENIIDCCPDDIWEEKFNNVEFWRGL